MRESSNTGVHIHIHQDVHVCVLTILGKRRVAPLLHGNTHLIRPRRGGRMSEECYARVKEAMLRTVLSL